MDTLMPARPNIRDFQTGMRLRGNFTMRCNHCREWNAEEEHRCRRCGRRMMSAGGFEAESAYKRFPVTMGAAAPRYLESEEQAAQPVGIAIAHRNESPAISEPRHQAQQTTLFGRSEGMKVVSISPEAQAAPVKRESPRRTSGNRPPSAHQCQQAFEFTTPEIPVRRHADTSIEAVIYCSDPVASITHRTLATVADLVLIAIAVGFFAIAFSLAGGEIIFNRQTALVYAAIPVIITLFYKFLWAIAGADSPGMQWARLRTVNFDGKRPELIQRFVRQSAGCLGLAAVGIGFFWSFVDEETLTWHDHISNTFVTHV